MRSRLVTTAALSLSSLCAFAQGEWELFQRAQDAFDAGECQTSVRLCDSLMVIGSAFNMDGYYYLRAQGQECIGDDAAALRDVERSLGLRGNFCPALALKARLLLHAGDRAGACAFWHKANALCVDHYTREIRIHCDPDWDYTQLHKVHCKDPRVVEVEDAHYVGCSERVSDTSYFLDMDLLKKGDWEIYYDTALMLLCTRLYTRNDTLYSIYFFRSGQRKLENREVDLHWVYTAEWCENGQLITAGPINAPEPDTAIAYHCNGRKNWEAVLWQGRAWGTERRWFANGQLRSEVVHTALATSGTEQDRQESVVLAERYWDENGKPIERPSDLDITNINTAGAPNHLSQEELGDATPYYDVDRSTDYDGTMRRLAERAYAVARPKCQSPCKVGEVYLDFVIDQNGAIKDAQVSRSLDPCADQTFLDVLHLIGTWPPATVQGTPVNVLVRMAFALERIAR